jgi:hypothetical protein
MARDRQKYVTLYAPGGTEVEVPEKRGEVLKERGYTTSKPRNPRTNNERRNKGDNSSELQAEIERLKVENEALKNPPTNPPKQG